MALMTLEHADIAPEELKNKSFGRSTRDAVQNYKDKRKIINSSYQNSADAIVGKMTIERLDNDLLGRKHTSDPLTDPGEKARIQALINRERRAVTRIVENSIELLRQLLEAMASEDPGTLVQFEAKNILVMDALRRYCGMGLRPDAALIKELIGQYEAFKSKLPSLARDQKPIDFPELLRRAPEHVEPTRDGPTFPPAITDRPDGMFFTPRYRDVDVNEKPQFQGMAPAILELIQLHEMGHFYFGFDDGNPVGGPFFVTKRFAQTYEFFSKQAVFRIRAP
jgi:hypothetical protein